MSLNLTLPLLVTALGIFLMIRLRLFFIIHPIRTAGLLMKTLSDKGSRRALTLALAGTLGVGNIFGVAMGIIIGGAGSVFWMLVSAIFAMAIKYAECTLTLCSSDGKNRGMHFVLKSSFYHLGEIFACLYASMCVALALIMGGAMQSGAVTDTAVASFGVNPVIFSAILVIFVIIGIIRGGEQIEKITSKIIPIATIVYIFMSIFAIIQNFPSLPNTINSIISSAFNLRSLFGGAGATLFLTALREGYARGILSNEAGVGTSAMAHSRSSGRQPAEAGVCGICEVIFDTVILCPLTALVILTSIENPSSYTSPMALVADAFFASIGPASGIFLFLSIVVFAYSTIICWYYYGAESVKYLFGGGRFAFTVIFLTISFFGEIIPTQPLVFVTDLLLLFMSLLTAVAIIRKFSDIRQSTEQAGLIYHR